VHERVLHDAMRPNVTFALDMLDVLLVCVVFGHASCVTDLIARADERSPTRTRGTAARATAARRTHRQCEQRAAYAATAHRWGGQLGLCEVSV
jgi:hypothetical protein